MIGPTAEAQKVEARIRGKLHPCLFAVAGVADLQPDHHRTRRDLPETHPQYKNLRFETLTTLSIAVATGPLPALSPGSMTVHMPVDAQAKTVVLMHRNRPSHGIEGQWSHRPSVGHGGSSQAPRGQSGTSAGLPPDPEGGAAYASRIFRTACAILFESLFFLGLATQRVGPASTIIEFVLTFRDPSPSRGRAPHR